MRGRRYGESAEATTAAATTKAVKSGAAKSAEAVARIQHAVKHHILSDAEFAEVHEVKVERPVSRVAWINFFIDELVMDVEGAFGTWAVV